MDKIVKSVNENIGNKFFKTVQIDNIVFRFHYTYTTIFLFFSTVLIGSQELIGEHIRCMISHENEEKDKALEHVASTYCYFLSTYTVAKHSNTTIHKDESVVHPGVGPHVEEDKIIWHAYYQWVLYVLFLQAVCFYIPHWVWKQFEGGRMRNYVKGIQEPDIKKQQENKKEFLDRAEEIFRERKEPSKYWATVHIVCELANLLNLILQVYLTDLFLMGNFLPLGTEVYTRYNTDTYNPLDIAFPKVTKCLFRRYGPSGTLQVHDIMCVMALNILHEKIYLILWYWYIIVGILTILGLVYRLLSFLGHSNVTFNDVAFSTRTNGTLDQDALHLVVKTINFNKWLFLRYLALNIQDVRIFNELLQRGVKIIKGGRQPRDSTWQHSSKEKLLNA